MTANDAEKAFLALAGWQSAGSGSTDEAPAICRMLLNRSAATSWTIAAVCERHNRESSGDHFLLPDGRDPHWTALLRRTDDVFSRSTADLPNGAIDCRDMSLVPAPAIPEGMTFTSRVGRVAFFRNPA